MEKMVRDILAMYVFTILWFVFMSEIERNDIRITIG